LSSKGGIFQGEVEISSVKGNTGFWKIAMEAQITKESRTAAGGEGTLMVYKERVERLVSEASPGSI